MTTASTSSARALVFAALAIVLAGCGAHTVKEVTGPPSTCEVRAEAIAKAAVIKTAYDAGQLGTAKQLGAYFKGIPRSTYLNADGTLRQYQSLSTHARLDFELWMNGVVQLMNNRVGERVRAASDRVRQSSINTGKPCKQVIASG